jgi:hypothetical protein
VSRETGTACDYSMYMFFIHSTLCWLAYLRGRGA